MSGRAFGWRDLARALRALGDPAAVAGVRHLAEVWRRHRAVADAFPLVRIHPEAVFRGWTPRNLSLGDGVVIGRGTLVYVETAAGLEGGISIGAGTYLGEYNNLRATEGTTIAIGGRCLVSQFCTVVSGNHGVARSRPIADQASDRERTGVVIGDDVWLGAGTALLAGARVATGAVIGANSVVAGEVPEYEIWAGAPAKKVGERR